MDNLIAQIHQSSKTVFTTKSLALIWKENDKNNLKGKIAYYVKRGNLIRLTRGVFAKKKDYDSRELAVGIYSPSYISFETVLRDKGVIFQHYDSVFIASLWSKKVTINKQVFVFRKLKDTILFNPSGILNQENYSIASMERAFLDTIYLFPNYYFDNLRSINWEKCFELVKIYNNKQLVKRLNKYCKNYAQ
jgi:hypothetical protein